MSQTIVLCADDYAFTPPISRAILDLAAARRISALSCMTASPYWREHGPWLQGVRENVDIGLHITLVDEAPLTTMPNTAPNGRLPSIGALILKSYLGQLDLAEVAAEIRAQKEAFEAVMGFSPQHLDGHLHTHVLPGIRDVVLDVAKGMVPRPWVRNIADNLSAILKRGVAVPKAAFLSALGKGLSRRAGSFAEHMNDSFSGVYAFSPRNRDYGAMFTHFIAARGKRHVILCHPGMDSDHAAHAGLRHGEHAFLKSSAFTDSLARHRLNIGRFADIPS
jgi:predicted glycoside hydrolase/deacetylase ChbG (UPF0249 family)